MSPVVELCPSLSGASCTLLSPSPSVRRVCWRSYYFTSLTTARYISLGRLEPTCVDAAWQQLPVVHRAYPYRGRARSHPNPTPEDCFNPVHAHQWKYRRWTGAQFLASMRIDTGRRSSNSRQNNRSTTRNKGSLRRRASWISNCQRWKLQLLWQPQWLSAWSISTDHLPLLGLHSNATLYRTSSVLAQPPSTSSSHPCLQQLSHQTRHTRPVPAPRRLFLRALHHTVRLRAGEGLPGRGVKVTALNAATQLPARDHRQHEKAREPVSYRPWGTSPSERKEGNQRCFCRLAHRLP